MTDFRDFKGAAKRLDDIDIPRIGAIIGVGEDEIHAFMDVEAAGAGFDSQGRPKMLFEPHVFYRNLSGEKLTVAIKAGLAYPTWGSEKYPADSYPRLKAAMAIDETAALKSASWGLGQILGSNHRMLGYSTVQAMVLDFMADEENHLEGIVQFLSKSGIDDELRARRWSTVARVYNGPSHAKHNYAGRMAAAFAKWQKIKDTPWSPGDQDNVGPTTPDEAMPVLRVGDGMETKAKLRPYVEKAQGRLSLHGFNSGIIDGKFGDATEKAVKAFQAAKGLTPDGVIGGFQTWPALLAEPAEPASEKRIQTSDTLVFPDEPLIPTKTVIFDDRAALANPAPRTFVATPIEDGGSYTPEIIATALVLGAMAAAVYFIL